VHNMLNFVLDPSTTNVATAENLDVMSEKFNAEKIFDIYRSVLVENVFAIRLG
jgi:hypothetical protein